MPKKRSPESDFSVPLLAALLYAISWDATTKKYVVRGEEVARYDSADGKGKPAGVMISSQVQSNLALLNVLPEDGGGTWNDRSSCIKTGPLASVGYARIKAFRDLARTSAGQDC